MKAISLRNAVAHGFKTSQFTPELVYELIKFIEQMLKSLHVSEAAS